MLSVVPRGGIEPPTHGFSVRAQWLLCQLVRLAKKWKTDNSVSMGCLPYGKRVVYGLALFAGLLCVSPKEVEAVRLTGVTSYAFNVNNLGGPATADSALACYWYNTNQISTGTIIQAVKYVGGVPVETFSIRHQDQRVTVYLSDGLGHWIEFKTSTVIPTNSTWNQVTVLIRTTTNELDIAVNGQDRLYGITGGNSNGFSLPVAAQTWTVGAGGTPTGPVNYYSGNLDQVYFHAWDGVYPQMAAFYNEACGINLGAVFAPIRPGPEGAYIVRETGNPVPIIILQGMTPGEFLYNHGGPSTFSGGSGMSTSLTDPFVLVPLQ
jgi:hypothetical protein